MVNLFFQNKTGGVFVEIGALDGLKFSTLDTPSLWEDVFTTMVMWLVCAYVNAFANAAPVIALPLHYPSPCDSLQPHQSDPWEDTEHRIEI